MRPTISQIQVAAYHRWVHRGGAHGWHSWDWVEAEQALLFGLNYRIVRHDRADGAAADVADSAHFVRTARRDTRVCRFCEQAEPRTSFAAATGALPECLAQVCRIDSSLICDECAAGFRDTIDPALAEFLDMLARGSAARRIPVDAYKGLVKAALATLPEVWIDVCQEAIEWVARGSDLYEPDLTRVPCPRRYAFLQPQVPFFALAVRTDADALMPAIVGILGLPHASVLFPVPFCALDDDLDGAELELPDVPIVDGLARWPGPTQSKALLLQSRSAQRGLVLEAALR